MTNISQLIPIVAKSIADAETLNANFQFLDSKIKDINMSGLEKTVNKDEPNGYCGLNAEGKIDSTIITDSTTEIQNSITDLYSKYSNLNNNSLSTKAITKTNNANANGSWQLSNDMTFKWKIASVNAGTIAAKKTYTYTWSYTKFPKHCVFAVGIPIGHNYTSSTHGISQSSSTFVFKNTNTDYSDNSLTKIFLFALGY